MKTLSITPTLALFPLTLSLLFGCAAENNESELKFEAGYSVAVDAVISDGVIISNSSSDYILNSAIEEQLLYTIGQLNGINGAPDMNRLEVTIGEKIEKEDKFEVHYSAKLFVSWPKDLDIPDTYEFILPTGGDYGSLGDFFEKYGSEEDYSTRCLAGSAHDVSSGIFWYYYRPERHSCPLKDKTLEDNLVVRTTAKLSLSERNTDGKSPEYEKVWEDQKLVVTAIFGKAEEGATGWDAGINAFKRLYKDLVSTYGEPTESNLGQNEQPSVSNDDIRLIFDTTKGQLDVHIYLVDGIRSVDQSFVEKYNTRTHDSDFISYSGHSGLGANIRALARMGEFKKGQYQIFLVNGCDTFAYVDDSLRDAHHKVNPDAGADKYFDIITNAMPSYFSNNSRSNMAVINGLFDSESSYEDILLGFHHSQRASVTGEADNRWPEKFLD